MNILLDYFFPITSIEPTPEASTAFLKQVCLVVLPAAAVPTGTPTLCTTVAGVAALTANIDATQLFAAGMGRVWILPMPDLDLATALAAHDQSFFTVLISSDFTKANIEADLDLGTFVGVTGIWSTDAAFLAAQAALPNRVAFHTTASNKAKNMAFAFGKLLSNTLNWRNQQYVTMALADDVNTLGAANTLFDAKVSFVISDTQFGNRLALFAAGGKAITAPYIKRNLQINMQSAALSYISGNQPAYTFKQAALIQDELQKVVDLYIANEEIELGTVTVGLEASNFVASSDINISEPKALWRVVAEMRQTL